VNLLRLLTSAFGTKRTSEPHLVMFGGIADIMPTRRNVRSWSKADIAHFRPYGAGAQPAFLTQNLHQPFGLISPSTSVQAFGSWNREQLLHS